MKFVSFAFALLALLTGLVAARYWYMGSKVEVVPLWEELGGMEPVEGSTIHWVIGTLTAINKSAALNKVAALWTAATVVLGAFSATIGSWPF